jgi:hypothetical protein
LLWINKHLAFVNRVSAPDAPFGYSFSRQPGFGTCAVRMRHPVVSLEAVAQARERIRDALDWDCGKRSPKNGLNAADGDRIRVTDTPVNTPSRFFFEACLPACGPPDSLRIEVPFGDGSKRAQEFAPDRGKIIAH